MVQDIFFGAFRKMAMFTLVQVHLGRLLITLMRELLNFHLMKRSIKKRARALLMKSMLHHNLLQRILNTSKQRLIQKVNFLQAELPMVQPLKK